MRAVSDRPGQIPFEDNMTQDAVSQDGTVVSGFHLGLITAGVWALRRALTDSASPSVAVAQPSSGVRTNTWTFLAGTFDASTGNMDLYVNDTLVATANDPTPFSTGSNGHVSIIQLN